VGRAILVVLTIAVVMILVNSALRPPTAPA
jgi:hypothetical protein